MIPAFVNDSAGTAQPARAALEQVDGFDVHDVPPAELGHAISRELLRNPARIVVAGGDGTVATAAAETCGTDTELAILPGGTLNHFARDHGIPTDLPAAAELARDGQCELADVAYVGERLFLNTSSVGAYVTYVRVRERMERYVGYHLASFVAAVRLFFKLRPLTVELEVGGELRRYSTPMVFIGVGERELKNPTLGSRVEGGNSCLHVLVVRERRAARVAIVALEAATRGLAHVARTPELDSFMVSSCSVDLKGSGKHVAVDGEIEWLQTPLRYRLERGALRIVVPDTTSRAASGPAT